MNPLNIASNSRPGSRHSSQPPSRAASDLSIESLDSYNQKVTSYKYVTKLPDKKVSYNNSRHGSINNLRDKLK